MKHFRLPVVVLFSGLLCLPLSAQTQKLTAEEVVAKSLAAIAPPKDRAAVKYFELSGTVKINATRVGLDTDGTAILLSEGNKVKFALKTPSKLYPIDQFVFDGKEVRVATDPRGGRSPLGEFLWWPEGLLPDGLFGGVISTAWPLYGTKLRNKGKLDYDGLQKVDGTDVYVLSYTSKNVDSNSTVKLLFDAATFRHVKTIYDLQVPTSAGGQQLVHGSVDANYRMARYTFEEAFSNFHQLGPYTLPLHDRLSLTTDTGTGNWYFDVNYNKLNGTDLSPILK